MELKELAGRLNVDNILVSHINSGYYKDSITIIVDKDLVINYVGKTYTFVPLSMDGINKGISKKDVSTILNAIKIELKDKSI